MITIKKDCDTDGGMSVYELRINGVKSVEFFHHEDKYGLSRLLREAAEAIDREDRSKLEKTPKGEIMQLQRNDYYIDWSK